ncbi:hypothetical protein CUT44_22285 [Streptomyces carminius]|uniref:DUF4352 domain-containing protein n=1 Tax=Streptomyces carminius TaxID=2665496 RepID=A0A2M8LUQ4_9ACTN|nr:DUF4352 domain-containing protein [Streptomyces carminius]PJE95691.1 hypothetical protein CUT44_22285 [Streptomyces carminius]
MPAQQTRPARKRLTAAAAVAVLALGGLTACGTTEEPTVTKATAAGADKSTEKSGDAKAADKKETAADGPLGAGDTASYDSGLGVTVSEAAAYTPGEYSAGHTEGNKAYKVTVTLANNGDEKIDISLIMPTARAGEEGVTAEQVFDSENGVGDGFQGNLLPGKKATAVLAFDVPADAKNLDVEVDLLDFTSEPAQWSLPL